MEFIKILKTLLNYIYNNLFHITHYKMTKHINLKVNPILFTYAYSI